MITNFFKRDDAKSNAAKRPRPKTPAKKPAKKKKKTERPVSHWKERPVDAERVAELHTTYPFLSKETREVKLTWMATYDGGRYVPEDEVLLEEINIKSTQFSK